MKPRGGGRKNESKRDEGGKIRKTDNDGREKQSKRARERENEVGG